MLARCHHGCSARLMRASESSCNSNPQNGRASLSARLARRPTGAQLLSKIMQLHQANPPMPIIVGVPRSGTTLLRFILDAHPDLAIPPETGFLVPLAAHAGQLSADALCNLVTTYPPEYPGWADFGISAEMYRSRLHQIEPFDVSE